MHPAVEERNDLHNTFTNLFLHISAIFFLLENVSAVLVLCVCVCVPSPWPLHFLVCIRILQKVKGAHLKKKTKSALMIKCTHEIAEKKCDYTVNPELISAASRLAVQECRVVPTSPVP